MSRPKASSKPGSGGVPAAKVSKEIPALSRRPDRPGLLFSFQPFTFFEPIGAMQLITKCCNSLLRCAAFRAASRTGFTHCVRNPLVEPDWTGKRARFTLRSAIDPREPYFEIAFTLKEVGMPQLSGVVDVVFARRLGVSTATARHEIVDGQSPLPSIEVR
jgi:hypothetical protein